MASLVLQDLKTFGPDHCQAVSYEQAVSYTKNLTQSQYENFTVVSWFLPKPMKQDFHAVYSFCRWADDLGDEVGDPAKSIELLDWWRSELDACYAGSPKHPVYIALQPVIQKHDIPRKPFDDLIDAFVQDQSVNRYDTWEQVLDYCTRSADPVGRLVLYMCGYRDEQLQKLSDATCTALQLTNFWQDVRRDVIERDRVYIPRDIARANGLSIDDMVDVIKSDGARRAKGDCCSTTACVPTIGVNAILPPYRKTVAQLCSQTWPLFTEGRKLLPGVSRDVRIDIKLFTLGGEAILRRIAACDFNTLETRPKLTKPAKLGLMMRAVFARLLSPVLG
jgi:squalene synthase HpnC